MGSDIYIRYGELLDWQSAGNAWKNIGPLTTIGVIAEDPKEDVARHWGWKLDNTTLLEAAFSDLRDCEAALSELD